MNNRNATLRSASPFFIVRNLRAPIEYYCRNLGFRSMLEVPEEDPHFANVCRDDVSFCLKETGLDTMQ